MQIIAASASNPVVSKDMNSKGLCFMKMRWKRYDWLILNLCTSRSLPTKWGSRERPFRGLLSLPGKR